MARMFWQNVEFELFRLYLEKLISILVGYENLYLYSAKITGLFKILLSGELRQVTFFNTWFS